MRARSKYLPPSVPNNAFGRNNAGSPSRSYGPHRGYMKNNRLTASLGAPNSSNNRSSANSASLGSGSGLNVADFTSISASVIQSPVRLSSHGSHVGAGRSKIASDVGH